VRLCEAEEELDLLRYTVDGWSAWPVIRFEVSLALAGLAFHHRSVVSRATRIRQALRDVPKAASVEHARHVIQTYSSGLIDQEGDRYRDIWFDDVVLAAGSTYKIETLNNPRFEARSNHARFPRHVWSSSFEISAAILRQLRPSPDVSRVATPLGRALQDRLNLPDLDERWVARRLQRFSSLRTIYAALMRRVHPSYVMVVNASHHGLIAAAKEQGAVVLEQQHGITDRSNASYSWPGSAASYRHMMPIPDRLLLHGPHWKNELAGNGFWGDDLRVVGSPRLDRHRNQPTLRNDDGPCTVVFTTQGLDSSRVIEFLTRFADRMVMARRPYRLTIKLHPIYDVDKQLYLDAFRPYGESVSVIAGDESPSSLELLKQAHLHVSVASASHYEAISLGVPTVILPFITHELVMPLHHAGHAWLARTPEDLAALVGEWQTLRVPRGAGEHYFRPGASANVLRELGLGRMTEGNTESMVKSEPAVTR